MPRRPRQEAPGALHHVVVQAASDSAIVADDVDRGAFLDELRRVVSECGWSCIAYCVMTTHAHLVLLTPEANLGRGMKLLLGRYAFSHNRRHGRPAWSPDALPMIHAVKLPRLASARKMSFGATSGLPFRLPTHDAGVR